MIFKTKKKKKLHVFSVLEKQRTLRGKKKKRFHSRRTLRYTRTEKCFSLTYLYRNEGTAVSLSSS